jgi:ABC-type branched-subunit amino acid transport system substrate-binding protein
MSRHLLASSLAALGLMALGACASKPAPVVAVPVALFGVDGNMSSDFGKGVIPAADIAGMAGTAPLTPLPAVFRQRLLTLDPAVVDFDYAAESYDSVIITALATTLAGSTDGKVIATYINGVTTAAPGAKTCGSYPECLAAYRAGHDVAYRGLAVRSGFTDQGEPSTASYGTKHFDGANAIDDAKTEYVNTGDAGSASTRRPPTPVPADKVYAGAALKLGVLLPKTGQLAIMGHTLFGAVKLGIADVNAAGGVLGLPVEAEYADDGTDAAIALDAAKTLFADKVSVLIGPSTSGASLKVLPAAVEAGVVEFSPSATSAALSDVADHGLFFRTAPSDNLQAQAIADVIMRAGAQKVFIVARNDAYGTGLEQTVAAALAAAGVPSSSIGTAEYPGDASEKTSFAGIASKIKTFQPDSVLLVGYTETAEAIAAMADQKITFTAP